MKISFIIPVYKVEKYLDECVQSILTQTYRNYEILLVDDGSPDRCPALCDNWARIDDRIKSLHKPNGGLSDARNYGLINATGDYVVFIDSDDKWIYNTALEELVGYIDNNHYDFIQFNGCYWYPNGTLHKWIEYESGLEDVVTSSKIITSLVSSGTFSMSACFKIINRSFLIENKIFFEKGIISEDVPWMFDLLDKAKHARFINKYIYAYRQNVQGSITNTLSLKSELDVLNNIKREIEKLPSRSFNDEAKKALMSFNAYQYTILLGSIDYYCGDDKQILIEKLKPYEYLLEYNISPKVRIVNIIYKFAGLFATRKILHLYHRLRIRRLSR